MFKRIKRALSPGKTTPRPVSDAKPHSTGGPESAWAGTQGWTFSADASGEEMAIEGKVGGKRWRLEVGRPARDFIVGKELRARTQLGIDQELAVLVMSRPLKDVLEKKAYQIYTDDLQTSIDSRLPQEMRWLAMMDEMGWDGPPAAFWERFSVYGDSRNTAPAWITPPLVRLLLEWPSPAPPADVPFMLVMLAGKVYLRMQYEPAILGTLQHAALIFTSACEAASSSFPPRKTG